MKALVTKKGPYLKANSYNPISRTFEEICLNQMKSKKVLLVFYPLDFTFVCPTEIVELSNLNEDFLQRNTQIICCSTDSHFSHKAWAELPSENGGFDNKLKIPLLSGSKESTEF